VFTARYALSPYIKQISFVFTGLISTLRLSGVILPLPYTPLWRGQVRDYLSFASLFDYYGKIIGCNNKVFTEEPLFLCTCMPQVL
jgi:hypothetical protein